MSSFRSRLKSKVALAHLSDQKKSTKKVQVISSDKHATTSTDVKNNNKKKKSNKQQHKKQKIQHGPAVKKISQQQQQQQQEKKTLSDRVATLNKMKARASILKNEAKQHDDTIRSLNNQLTICASQKSLSHAVNLFTTTLDEHKNAYTYTIMCNVLLQCGKLSEAIALFEHMDTLDMSKNIVSYTQMLNGLGKAGRVQEMMSLFKQMISLSIRPNIRTINTLLRAALINGVPSIANYIRVNLPSYKIPQLDSSGLDYVLQCALQCLDVTIMTAVYGKLNDEICVENLQYGMYMLKIHFILGHFEAVKKFMKIMTERLEKQQRHLSTTTGAAGGAGGGLLGGGEDGDSGSGKSSSRKKTALGGKRRWKEMQQQPQGQLQEGDRDEEDEDDDGDALMRWQEAIGADEEDEEDSKKKKKQRSTSSVKWTMKAVDSRSQSRAYFVTHLRKELSRELQIIQQAYQRLSSSSSSSSGATATAGGAELAVPDQSVVNTAGINLKVKAKHAKTVLNIFTQVYPFNCEEEEEEEEEDTKEGKRDQHAHQQGEGENLETVWTRLNKAWGVKRLIKDVMKLSSKKSKQKKKHTKSNNNNKAASPSAPLATHAHQHGRGVLEVVEDGEEQMLKEQYLHHFDEKRLYAKPVVLEICSGNGDWLCTQAKANPDMNFVALEIRRDRVCKAVMNSVLHDVGNITHIACDANVAVRNTKLLRTGMIECIFINHPQPPQQRGHYHGDITSEAEHLLTGTFLQSLHRLLRPSSPQNKRKKKKTKRKNKTEEERLSSSSHSSTSGSVFHADDDDDTKKSKNKSNSGSSSNSSVSLLGGDESEEKGGRLVIETDNLFYGKMLLEILATECAEWFTSNHDLYTTNNTTNKVHSSKGKHALFEGKPAGVQDAYSYFHQLSDITQHTERYFIDICHQAL